MSYSFPSFPLNYTSPWNMLPPPRLGNDSTVGRVIAWVVIWLSVAVLVWSNVRQSRNETAEAADSKPGMQLEISGRYAIGAHILAGKSGQADPAAGLMVMQLDKAVTSPADQLAIVTIVAEVEGKSAAVERLNLLEKTLPARLSAPAEALRNIYTKGPDALSIEQRKDLNDSLGWFAKLALTFDKPAANPQRAEVLSAAKRTMAIIAGISFAGIFVLIAAVVLCIFFIVQLASNRLPRNYRPTPAGGVFLEAFAIYLGGVTASMFGAGLLPEALQKNISAHVALMVGPTIIAILWPLIRGADLSAWRAGMGWHTGRGIFREMGMGLLGYIAGFPILGVGMAITIALINIAHAHPTHPVDKMIGVSPMLTLIVLSLASVYAPITEETMFRGAFFHALRARHRWLLSAFVSSFIFAAVHPQGWTVIPVLMSIAIVFAGIREWRGTIFSSAAAHCLHNTVLVLMATLLMQS